MKHKLTTFGLAALLLLGGAALSLKEYSNKNSSPVLAAQHASNFDEYTYSGSYYESITATGEGINGTLRKALSGYILPKEWPSYSGNSTNSLAQLCQQADEDPTNKSNMIYLYTRDSVTKNEASSWNREHVWPKSLSGGNWGTGKAGTDLLHLRPTYNTCNSTRSSIPFGDVEGGKERIYNDMTYAWTGGGYYMPLDSAKGDIARIIMYIWVAYTDYYSNLPAITKVFRDYDTLLKWHTEDRPDVMEGHRNDFCQSSLQKNRNPFVDHPEYAWMIFGDSASSSVKAACKAAYPGGSVATLTSISVSSLPTKTIYYLDEELDTTGLKVVGNYSNGEKKDITSECSFSPTSFDSLGDKTINVSYGGKSTSFTVTVKDYEAVNLTSVVASFSETKFYTNKNYQINTQINPSDVYPVPTLSYSSSDTDIATVSSSGLITTKAIGAVTITVTATQNLIVKSDTVDIVVAENEMMKISDIYDLGESDKEVSIKVYGQYIGAYNEVYKGLFIGDGNYAIMVYGYSGSVSSFTAYKTYVQVEGTLDIYNNLYEIKSPTITIISDEVGKMYVDNVVTYEFDGHESDEEREDIGVRISSRPCIISGIVKSHPNSIINSKDSTVVITLDNGQDATVFAKKKAGLDYNTLNSYLTVDSNQVTVKGFVSVYGSQFQLILPTIVEQSDTYKASDFAEDFLYFSGTICADNGLENNKGELIDLWTELELNYYPLLKDSEKAILKNASANASGTDIEQAMARYDYIVAKYSIKNFILRDVSYLGALLNYTVEENVHYTTVVVIISLTMCVAFGGVILLRRKKK